MAKSLVTHPCIAALVLAMAAGPAMAQENKEAPPPPVPAPAAPVAPATLNKLFSEAEAAFAEKKYPETAAKITELLKLAGNKPAFPLEMLHFNLGLANLLGGKAAEAERAFEECAEKFPKGEYTSRCYLGIGKAALAQEDEEKRKVAVEALKKAAEDPEYRMEAELALGQVYIADNQVDAALALFRSLMGSDVKTPQQTAAVVEVIGLLGDLGKVDELSACLDFAIAQPGVQDGIAWFSNQVVVKGDAVVAAAGDSEEMWEAALAIYRSVPPRAQILEFQTTALEKQRAELAFLKARRAAEEPAGNFDDLAKAQTSINQAEGAIRQMETAKAAIEGMKDFDAALLMRRGRCCYYLIRREEALMCFTTIREKYSEATDAQAAAFAEIVVYNELRDSDKVQALSNAYMAKYPQAPNIKTVALLVGQVLISAGDWAKVQSYYEGLASRFPQSADLAQFRYYIAVAVFQQGEFLKAAEMFQQLLTGFPQLNPQLKRPAMYRIAMGYFLSNRYVEARLWCEKYLQEFKK